MSDRSPQHFVFVGAGAVGGYYGARLAKAGTRVTFLARGANLKAIRERGLLIWSPLGDFLVRPAADDDPRRIGAADVVVLTVKNYDNPVVLPALQPLVGPDTVVLTLQNGVDSVREIADIFGERAVLGGPTYIATALVIPGIVEQTGTHRRVVLGEVFGDRSRVSERAARIAETMRAADIDAEAVPDGLQAIWEKFVQLVPFAGLTGACRLPIGGVRTIPETRAALFDAAREVARVALAENVALPADLVGTMERYVDALPADTKSSLLIDLEAGKRIEVEALQGAVVRRGRAANVPTPVTSTLYAVLKPHAQGRPT
jgi:2-dehydropantoate 2-reductase